MSGEDRPAGQHRSGGEDRLGSEVRPAGCSTSTAAASPVADGAGASRADVLGEIRQQRIDKVRQLRDLDLDPYPPDAVARAPIAEARNSVESLRWVIGISTTKGRSTAAQLQARGVRPYAEIAATDPPTRAFAGSLPDDPMQLAFRADKPMMVITHRHYFRTIDRSDTGRIFANQPSF